MQNTPAEIVRQLLIDLGKALPPENEAEWSAYCAAEPGKPDNCVTIYDTGGTGHGRMQSTGEIPTHFGVQVRVRSETIAVGQSKVREIAAALATVKNRPVTIGENHYVAAVVNQRGSVLALGKDRESHRFLFTANFLVALGKSGRSEGSKSGSSPGSGRSRPRSP